MFQEDGLSIEGWGRPFAASVCFVGVTLAGPAAATETIVVASERRAIALRDVASSISVLNEDEVLRVSPRAPAELLNRAAGTFVQSGSGREHLTAIRSPVLTGGAGAGSFLFLQDGVPLRAPGFANINALFHASFPFAQQVEIVRGPGDVAYGSNALHGAINVRTPDAGEAANLASLSYGSFQRTRAVVTGSTKRASTGISYLRDGGYRDNSGVDEFKSFSSIALGNSTLRITSHQLNQETAGFVIGDNAYEEDELRRTNPNPEAFRDVRHVLVSLETPFDRGGWSGTVTPYVRWTDMEFLQHFLPGDALEENEHTSLGFQSTAFRQLTDRLELTAGFDLDATRGSLREFQENPTVFSFVQGLHYDYNVDAVEAAPFARISYQATEKLRLQAGLRGTFTHYDYETEAEPGTVGRFQRPDDRTDDFSVATGKVAALYDLSDEQSVYLSLARGARPPQTTELYRIQINQDVSDIEPETLDSLELGWRADAGWGQMTIAGFAMKKENVFFRDADGFNVTDGETTHIGVEIEAVLPINDVLTISGSGTYAEHRYDFDRVVGNTSEVIEDGDFVDTAPKTLASARLLYTPNDRFTFEATYTHVGQYETNAANTVSYPGHDLLDLRAEIQLNDRVSIAGIARNVTDQRYARRADFAFGNERYFPGEERAGEVVLRARF
ncbi:MAG: TonB-dependent receptor [Pseudomonadota bacterium]